MKPPADHPVTAAVEAVARRIAAAAGEKPTGTYDEPQGVTLNDETWALTFAATGLDARMVMAAIRGAAAQSGSGALVLVFWLGWELAKRDSGEPT